MNEHLICEASVRKIVETVDAGLVGGLGKPIPGNMCVEAAVCYGLGLPHADDPGCVSRAVRALKIKLNDSGWSSPAARAKGLRRLAVVQLGTKDKIDEIKFAKLVSMLAKKLAYAADAAKATADAAYATADAAKAAAYAAADSAAYAAAYAASDKILSDFAEAVVQILIELKAPGAEYLYLTGAQ
jgi:hypothetical protein